MVISFGDGYNKTVESDILLLNISNNEAYIWTTIFDPKMPSPPPPSLPPSPPPSTLSPLPPPSTPSPSPSLSSSSPLNNSGNIAGMIVVGSLLSGILLSAIGSFLIYKWNKNKQKTIHENDNSNDYYSQEEKELPIVRNIHNYEQDINNNEQETIQIDQIPTLLTTYNFLNVL
ncbi:hypothetical protein RhiirA5_423173 [Rhizophagus irregularis]|uniref:Uncharacterized protein n=1 Tax=Rhizophagus irregularis TaxID=588596 RepID=A0A2N0PAI1_9GLOM|nr:hypothetical protein RhiirA5_423173 [Rhizophagus irregularis]